MRHYTGFKASKSLNVAMAAYAVMMKSFTNYIVRQGAINNPIFNMVEDKVGNIWFCATSGVSRYDGTTFTNFTEKRGKK